MINLITVTMISMCHENDVKSWEELKRGHLERGHAAGACPGGGGQGAWAPPRNLKAKKKKKKVIRAYFKLFHLYFATFLVENIIFSAIF